MDSPPSPEIDTEVDPPVTYSAPPLRIRWGFSAMCAAALLILAVSLSLANSTAGVSSSPGNGHPAAATIDGGASPALVKLAAAHPAKQVEAIVQFKTGVEPGAARELVRSAGGRVTGDLHVINGLVVRMTAAQANGLASREDVRAVSLNRGVRKNSIDAGKLATSYNQSLTSDQVWSDYGTGQGVGVAVVDTGIADYHDRLRGRLQEQGQLRRLLPRRGHRRHEPRGEVRRPTSTATARTSRASSPATGTTAASRTRCTASTWASPPRRT